MAITGLRRWDLHRLRFGWGRIETVTYPIFHDPEIIGAVLEHAERFVVTTSARRSPRPAHAGADAAGGRPGVASGRWRAPLTVERAALLERYREPARR